MTDCADASARASSPAAMGADVGQTGLQRRGLATGDAHLGGARLQAAVGPRQLAHGRQGPLGRGRICQHREQRLELAQAIAQARAAAVEQLARGLVTDVRGHAGLFGGAGPASGVGVELGDQRRGRRAGVGQRTAGEARQQRVASARAIDLADPGRRGATVDLRRLDQRSAGRHGHQQRRQPGDCLVRAVRVAREGGEQGGEVGVTRARIDVKALLDGAADRRRHAVVRRRGRATAQQRAADLLDRGAGERPLAVERLPQGHAVAELIAARVGRRAEELLGRHVRGRADEAAVLGEQQAGHAHVAERVELGLAIDRRRQAEVEHARAAVLADDDVVGLDVAVDHAARVGRLQARADLHEHRQHRPPVARRVGQPLAQGAAVDQLHGDVDPALDRTDLVDLNHVRVRQPGERLGLALEAGGAELVLAGVLVAEDLDRQAAVELGVVRGVDDPHRACAELPQDDEAADPRRREQSLDSVAAARRRDKVSERVCVGCCARGDAATRVCPRGEDGRRRRLRRAATRRSPVTLAP
ncbi:hypothetical protein OV079_39910 [Nannocystis pusilla]|uniref:Uncharacterized protein n=1 Tax=Nannocystis pusilla TaxID=889268 RepID=A0A9X3EWY3_9BACT|nr:hypothetical protein [Nannocystis pusilla]MCY1011626.1 hypothetical protein [Nannocystis pusilla]